MAPLAVFTVIARQESGSTSIPEHRHSTRLQEAAPVTTGRPAFATGPRGRPPAPAPDDGALLPGSAARPQQARALQCLS
ncbi:hypothetical protein NDU88_005645 [Pleurodeles waltl]|uniref:Uncharacterized protein n=1 Tax=Pleurodeles waltl TaxID=8319 RepID=A0AAV7TUK2_PLEWA|nr:hypothetical protein NDU88_005645 [Pleurodeles waltl]